VKATGVSGEKFLIELFDASSGGDEELYFVGITQSAINDQSAGIVVSEGYVKHLNTSSYSVGNILYASETAGALTTTKPTSPNLGIAVAMVTKVDGTNGTIYVRPTIYAHLEELHDVLLTSPASGEVLKYDGTKWVNGTVSASGLSSTGDVTVQLDSDNNTSGSKFEILAGDGTTIFSIDETGTTAGYLTLTTPAVTLGSSSYQVGSSGAAIIGNYSASNTYVADIYSSTGINQNITVTNTNGLLTWTNPPIIATDWELRVYALRTGFLASAVSVDSFDTTASTTFKYWRFKAVEDGTLDDTVDYVYLENLGIFTSTNAGGTEYPTTNLTSPTSESGIVISSGYNYPSSSSYDEWKAFDSSATSGWWSIGLSTNGYTGADNWIQIELSTSTNIQSVKIETGNFMQTGTIILYGSNTGAFSGEEVEVKVISGLTTYDTEIVNI
jgi:hypothetical protein